MTATWEIRQGHALDRLREMPDESVQCCVTSPPYFGLRDYGTGEWDGGDSACEHMQEIKPGTYNQGFNERSGNASGRRKQETAGLRPYRDVCGRCGARRVDRQIGLEATPDEFVAKLVGVFREVRRVLRSDGTCWVVIGDSYASAPKGNPGALSAGLTNNGRNAAKANAHRTVSTVVGEGVKPKDLLGIPWLLAFALRADGWYLRSDVIWSKPNPMPESVTDRPTSAHEHVFLLAKSRSYFYDADAIREPAEVHGRPLCVIKQGGEYETLAGRNDGDWPRSTTRGFGADEAGRNKRNVWGIATQPYADAHFATFPPKLVEPCVLAGTSPKACGECGAPWKRIARTDIGRRRPARITGRRRLLRLGLRGACIWLRGISRARGW